jgi:hypothetical protein
LAIKSLLLPRIEKEKLLACTTKIGKQKLNLSEEGIEVLSALHERETAW